jgi:serine/threonine protein kinase
MNERVLNDPTPARELNPKISPEIEEVLFRALERDPRHRYATAAEMDWELEHPELVGVDEGRRLTAKGRLPGGRKLLLYAALALVPVALFVVMLLLAKR